jgi:hypothetical protein
VGVQGICVTAQSLSDGTEYSATTKQRGHYTIAVPDGTYRVWFTDCRSAPVYAKQFWHNAPFNDATPVTIGGTKPVVSGIDAALRPGGWIEGTVTDARSGVPLSNIRVVSWAPNVDNEYATSDSAGHYAIGPLLTGEYGVAYQQVWQPNAAYATAWYDQQPFETAAKVSVTAPNRTHVDLRMAVGGVITGRLTDAATGNPLAGAGVNAFDSYGHLNWAMTASDGTYRMTQLFADTYTVEFLAHGVTQWWNGQSSAQTATPLGVAFYSTYSGIDGVLPS